MPLPPSTTSRFLKPVHCSPNKQEPEVDSSAAILCERCNGRGWLLCDFCKGQKTNVKSDTNRTYRRCPSCRAIGYVLCSKCKVFKCVTFPNYNDGEEFVYLNPNSLCSLFRHVKDSYRDDKLKGYINGFYPTPSTSASSMKLVYRVYAGIKLN